MNTTSSSSSEYPWGAPGSPAAQVPLSRVQIPPHGTSAAQTGHRGSPTGSPPSNENPVTIDHSATPEDNARKVFIAFRSEAERISKEIEGFVVTDVSDVDGQRRAGEYRKVFKRIRCDAENTRKRLVENLKKTTSAIDAEARVVRRFCEEHEERLERYEHFIKYEQLRVEAELRESRTKEITPYLTGPAPEDIGRMSESDYLAFQEGLEAAHRAREEQRIREEEEAERRRKEAEAERLRLVEQNRKLQADLARQAEAAAAAAKAAEEARRQAAQAEAARIAQAESTAQTSDGLSNVIPFTPPATSRDSDKLRALAAQLQSIVFPDLRTASVQDDLRRFEAHVRNFTSWLHKAADSLAANGN